MYTGLTQERPTASVAARAGPPRRLSAKSQALFWARPQYPRQRKLAIIQHRGLPVGARAPAARNSAARVRRRRAGRSFSGPKRPPRVKRCPSGWHPVRERATSFRWRDIAKEISCSLPYNQRPNHANASSCIALSNLCSPS